MTLEGWVGLEREPAVGGQRVGARSADETVSLGSQGIVWIGAGV